MTAGRQPAQAQPWAMTNFAMRNGTRAWQRRQVGPGGSTASNDDVVVMVSTVSRTAAQTGGHGASW